MSDYQTQSPEAGVYRAAYTYTIADYKASRQAKRRLSPFLDEALWRWRYVGTLGFALALTFFTGWSRNLTLGEIVSWHYLSSIAPYCLSLFIFIALIDVLFDRAFIPWVFRRFAIANKKLSVAFNDNGIIWSSEGFKGELAWRSVTRLVTLKGYLFLFISKMEAICIPQRAFASEGAFKGLVTYAKERVNGQAL